MKDRTTDRTGWVILFLDRAPGRWTGGSDLLGIERRWVEDMEAGIQDLGPFDNLAEEGGGVQAAGLEHLTSAFTECYVR